MGRNNKQRRAAKKRRRQQPRPTPPRPPRQAPPRQSAWRNDPAPPTVDQLVGEAVAAYRVDETRYAALLAALAERGERACDAIRTRSVDAVGALWERGWSPVEAAHVATRRLSAAHAELLADAAVAEARRQPPGSRGRHPRFEAQLAALGHHGLLARPAHGSLGHGIELLWLLVVLPDVPRAVPLEADDPAGDVHRGLDERMLARVRALLAKAESTEFDEEAEALTAKAQELISRHAIDDALLRAAEEAAGAAPTVRRLLLDDPYADPKSTLVAKVAAANRCRAVYSPDLAWSTVFGSEADLDAVELLVASLLAQATGSMARLGSQRDALGRSRTRSFRRSFLLGFAVRIGQRLRDTTDAQVGAAAATSAGERLLPVLAARDDRIRTVMEAAFPDVVTRASSVSNGSGWAAGQAAADLASLRVSSGTLAHGRTDA